MISFECLNYLKMNTLNPQNQGWISCLWQAFVITPLGQKNPEWLCQRIFVLICINYNYLAVESSDDKFWIWSELSEKGQTKSSKSISPLVADLVLDLLVKVNWDFLPFFTLVVAVKFWWFAQCKFWFISGFIVYSLYSGSPLSTNFIPTALKFVLVETVPAHRGAFCQFPFRWIYYYGSNKSKKGNWQNATLCSGGPPEFSL